MTKWLPDSPEFSTLIEQLSEGLSDDRVEVLRAGILAYVADDLEGCRNNGRRVIPIYRFILRDYTPACPLGEFMAVLAAHVVKSFARIQGWFEDEPDPEVVAMTYLATEFPLTFPKLVTRNVEVEAAARKLDQIGRHHGWWPESTPTFDEMGTNERWEFLGAVGEILAAARAAKV